MPARLRLYDLKLSRLPRLIGACAADTPTIAQYVNAAELRLLYAKEAGNEGWWGTWAEMAFTITRDQPYLTTPRRVARLEYVAACDEPVVIQNQFYEYLQFGNGRLPKQWITNSKPRLLSCYSRNMVPTFTDLSNPPQYLTAYLTDVADVGKRIFFQGTDSSGNELYSYTDTGRAPGVYVRLESPFATAATIEGNPIGWQTITGIQKDITEGQVQVFQTDPTTGVQVLLVTLEPGEQVASYRRYYFDALPPSCCSTVGQTSTITLTAMAKLDHIPVQVDSDYTTIQCAEALIEECSAVRYRSVDTMAAKSMAAEAHANAIRMLNGELKHFMGTDRPAVIFAPFGSATPAKRRVGVLV